MAMSVKLNISDMACSACVDTITKAVKNVDSSATVDADLQSKTVSIDTTQSEDDIKSVITEAGYTIA